MSKDEHTGSLVGLIPSTIQKDFYVQTAKQLVHQMPKWFEERDMPMKCIRKGISKRGSMTRAYSAGEKVIGTNMYADCYQEGYTDKYNISIEDCNELSHNLIGAINTVCPGPLETMSFLQKLSAYEIGTYKVFKDGKLATNKYKELKKEIKDLRFEKDKSDEDLLRLSEAVNELETYEQRLVEGNGSRDIRWTTPSGFYVIYENYLTRSIQCKGSIKGLNRISHVAKEITETPNLRGIMSGISPNFVHSMDSSHMAIVIDNWEGAFAAVHDAYASHADDIDTLVAITKESFIAMYDHDNFYDYIEETLLSSREGLTVEQPKLGNLNIEDIRNSDYFFA